MRHAVSVFPSGFLVILIVGVVGVDRVAGYETYHDPNLDDEGYCATCHPGFSAGREDSLHALHTGGTDPITTECALCHDAVGRDNPIVMWSAASGLPDRGGLGCMGCHGRDYGETIAADYRGFPTQGESKASGYGLRRHHAQAGINLCSGCHPDGDPAAILPESVSPPYYAKTNIRLNGEFLDPCDNEDSPDDADEIGLDNDGDLFYDASDPDCQQAPGPVISLVPNSLDFGTVDVGGGMMMVAEIQNVGQADLTVSSIASCAGTSPEFAFVSPAPVVIAPGGSELLEVTYTPTDGGEDTGCLEIMSDAVGMATIELQLRGSGRVAESAIALDPPSLNLGSVLVGGSASLATQIRNTGSLDLEISSLTLCGGTSSEFSWTPLASTTIPPGGSETLMVSYAPLDTGADSGCLEIASNAAGVPTINLNLDGQGVSEADPEIIVAPPDLYLGTIFIGDTVTRSAEVFNVGTGDLVISSIVACAGTSSEFSWTIPSMVIPPGGSELLRVHYTPVDEGVDTGCLEIASNDPGAGVVPLGVNGRGTSVTVALDCFKRGDSNVDGTVDISDGTNTLNGLFLGSGSLTCDDAADANDDGALDLTDAVVTFNWLFLGGPPPPEPGPAGCGVDPTDDVLTCVEYDADCEGACGDVENTAPLLGIVTNSLTGLGLPGAVVSIDPPIPQGSVTTDPTGAFSLELPVGIFTLSAEYPNFTSVVETITVLPGGIAVELMLEPVAPVIVTALIDGDESPGSAVTGTAVVEILDGSMLQSYSWNQVGGTEATVEDAASEVATITLGAADAFKAELIHVISEPPIGEDQLPPNVELPEGEFPGGLQNRFEIIGLNPFSLEEAALVSVELAVTTSSGTYSDVAAIHTVLPWSPSTGLRNVPIDERVLIQSKAHVDEDEDGFNDETGLATTYDWMLVSAPGGSTAMLIDATTQNPEFTPDVVGLYTLTVTDTTQLPGTDVVTVEIYAGTWRGVITGQDGDGRPLAANCTGCHNGVIALDKFTPWAQSGHAEILTNNLNTSTHYGPNCFPCHTVGYNPRADNGGADEASDYDEFLASGLLNNPGDNWTTMLADYPDTAQMANIQCENCHGPQDGGGAHFQGAPRIDISSNVCAPCHGEPLRHARFQQWQLSGHANYELAIDESQSGSCSRCHTGNGFLTWLPILLDDDPGTDPTANITVSWTEDESHPQTCVTCHDPHNPGSTTGINTNATVRISGNTPPLIAGFTAVGVGRGAICMTCHNSRRGLRNDSVYDEVVATGNASRAPHGSSQSDVIMGQNAYLVNVGIRGSHSFVEDTCVNCHMEQTPPPDILAYNLGGTNHTFTAREDICANCHGDGFNATGVQDGVNAALDQLQGDVEAAILALIDDLTLAGNTIDLGGAATITAASEIAEIVFGESRGRQAITVTLADMSVVGPVRVNTIDVLDATPAVIGELYDFADPGLVKSGWNWALIHNDGSHGVHNPSFAFQALDAALDALDDLAAE